MKKINIIFLIILLLLFATTIFSCKNKENETNDKQNETVADTTENEQVFTKPEKLNKNDIPNEIDYVGDTYYSRHWIDKNGENIFLLSVQETSNSKNDYQSLFLYGYHYVKKGSNYTLIRKIQDYEQKCEFDLKHNFYEDLINIADRNNDGFAEITFLYSMCCTSDYSPSPLKLLMLENGEKYAIRGYIPIYLGNGDKFGGEKNIDPLFDKASGELLSYANNLWDSLVTANYNKSLKSQLEYEISNLKIELQTAEAILEDLNNRFFLSTKKKEKKLREQYELIEMLKTQLAETEKLYNEIN